LDLAPLGWIGCNLWISPTVVRVAPLSGSASTIYTETIPAIPSLSGLTFFHQVFVSWLGAHQNGADVIVSNYARAVIGS
jgi:hypothetical protein